MRKILNIGLSIILILCGMHFTIVTHYCQGEIVALKVSFTGKSASCDFDMACRENAPSGTVLTKHCCDNELMVYMVDSYYSFPGYQYKINTLNNTGVNYFPSLPFFKSVAPISHRNPSISPPGYFTANAVDISAIQVFRT